MKISPLVKNNKTLIIVLGVTFVCACIMIIECLSVYGNIQEIMKKIEDEDAEIQRINEGRNPNPVKASGKIIQANTEKYRQKIRDIRRRIGNPYRESLKDFLRNLESAAFLKTAPLPPVELVVARGAAVKSVPAAKPVAGAASSDKEPVILRYSEDEIRSAFADFYSAYYSERKNTDDSSFSKDKNDSLVAEHEDIFDKFREKLVQPPDDMKFSSDEERQAYLTGALQTFDKAFYHFCLQVQKDMIEELDLKNENGLKDAKFIFLESLGLPRIMTPFACKAFADAITNNVRKNPSLIPGLAQWAKSSGKGKDAGIESRIKTLTYDHKGQNPPPENVVHILRHYQILQDLFRRMRDSKIQGLESVASPFSENTPYELSGETYREMGSDYKKFTYEVTLVSTVGEIRDFINQLHHAFEQNIVYDIQEISFTKLPRFDAVKSADEKVDALRKSAEKGAGDRGTEGEQTAQGEGAASAVSRTPEEIYTDPSYGNTLLGQDELVQVHIKFDYIVYVGEMLGKK